MTTNTLRVSDVSFTPASPADAGRGLVGHVTATIDGTLRFERIPLRRDGVHGLDLGLGQGEIERAILAALEAAQ